MVRVRDLIMKATERLKKVEIDTPKLDAEVLLSNLLEVDRIFFHMYPEKEVTKEIERKFWAWVEKRQKLMPVQYIVNKQEFMGLNFKVEEGVLIPRGDTEILVEKTIEIYKKEFSPDNVKIMDIGTGSGAIVVSLGKYIDNSNLTAIDISTKALNIAKENAKTHKVENKIRFLEGSLFDPIHEKDEYKTYDFIISNPPYIPKKLVNTLNSGVKDYEPHLALDGGEDGLDFYKAITVGAKEYLKNGGHLLFEIGHDQGEDLTQILNNNGFKHVEVVKDLASLDRVVLGIK